MWSVSGRFLENFLALRSYRLRNSLKWWKSHQFCLNTWQNTVKWTAGNNLASPGVWARCSDRTSNFCNSYIPLWDKHAANNIKNISAIKIMGGTSHPVITLPKCQAKLIWQTWKKRVAWGVVGGENKRNWRRKNSRNVRTDVSSGIWGLVTCPKVRAMRNNRQT